jgi:hypothetical protein
MRCHPFDTQPSTRNHQLAFPRRLSIGTWQNAASDDATMTGQDYRNVWLKLSGEAN